MTTCSKLIRHHGKALDLLTQGLFKTGPTFGLSISSFTWKVKQTDKKNTRYTCTGKWDTQVCFKYSREKSILVYRYPHFVERAVIFIIIIIFSVNLSVSASLYRWGRCRYFLADRSVSTSLSFYWAPYFWSCCQYFPPRAWWRNSCNTRYRCS